MTGLVLALLGVLCITASVVGVGGEMAAGVALLGLALCILALFFTTKE